MKEEHDRLLHRLGHEVLQWRWQLQGLSGEATQGPELDCGYMCHGSLSPKRQASWKVRCPEAKNKWIWILNNSGNNGDALIFLHDSVNFTTIVIIDDDASDWNTFCQPFFWSRYECCLCCHLTGLSYSQSWQLLGSHLSWWLWGVRRRVWGRGVINHNVIDAQVTMYYVAFFVQIFKSWKVIEQLNSFNVEY